MNRFTFYVSRLTFFWAAVGGLLSAVVLCPLRGQAADWSGSVDASFRLLDQGHLDELVKTSPANRFYFAAPSQNGLDPYLVLRPAGKLKALGFLEAGLGLDSGEVSSRAFDHGDFTSRAKNTYFLNQADLRAFLFPDGWFSLHGGFWTVQSAGGCLVDYPLLGLEAEGDLDIPLAVPLNFWVRGHKVDSEKIFDPDQKSFLLEGGVGYALGPKGKAKVFYDYFSDPDNFFKDLLNPVLKRVLAQRFGNVYQQLLDQFGDLIQNSSTHLHYLGASVEKEHGVFSGRGLLVYEFGGMDLSGQVPRVLGGGTRDFSVSLPIRGELLDVSLGVRPHQKIRLGGEFFWSSGDGFKNLKPDQAGGGQKISGQKINGFFSIIPQITVTNLFFNGGISQNLFAGSSQASGIDGHGVLAPVFSLSADPARKLSLDFRAALLLAQEGRTGGGSRYGEEFDLTFNCRVRKGLSALLESDILFPGNYFPAGSDPVWRVSAGIDYRFEF